MKLNLRKKKNVVKQEPILIDLADQVVENIKNGDDLYKFLVEFHKKVYTELDALHFDRLKGLLSQELKN